MAPRLDKFSYVNGKDAYVIFLDKYKIIKNSNSKNDENITCFISVKEIKVSID